MKSLARTRTRFAMSNRKLPRAPWRSCTPIPTCDLVRAEVSEQSISRAAARWCHAIGLADESPLHPAPPFRTLHLRYPVESLQEALAEGIVTGHPRMPEFQLKPNQIEDLIAYLKSLEDALGAHRFLGPPKPR
jgi:hypothetical protein